MAGAKQKRDGIEVRHRKHCKRPQDNGKCCGASFQAQAFDKRTGKPVKRSFSTKTAANGPGAARRNSANS